MDSLNNVSIHAFAISKSSDGTADVAYDLDVDGSNVLVDPIVSGSGFDKKRRVGSMRTDSNGDILEFKSSSTSGGGVKISYSNLIIDYTDLIIGTFEPLLSVPDGISLTLGVSLFAGYDGSTNIRTGYISSFLTPNSEYRTASLASNLSTSDTIVCDGIETDNARIRVRKTGSGIFTTFMLSTHYYIDKRIS